MPTSAAVGVANVLKFRVGVINVTYQRPVVGTCMYMWVLTGYLQVISAYFELGHPLNLSRPLRDRPEIDDFRLLYRYISMCRATQ
jgi:DMSO reductase anchor subunit